MQASVRAPLGTILACVRWIARIMTIPVFAFLVGEVVVPHGGGGGISPADLVLLAIWPGSMAIGLALGWKWELLGGVISVSILAVFYAAFYAQRHGFPPGPWFAAFTAPGFLFLLLGLVRLALRPSPTSGSAEA